MTHLKQAFDDEFDARCEVKFINPIDFMKSYLVQLNPNIPQEKMHALIDDTFIYTEDFEREYLRRERVCHDGTLLFTHELIQRTLAPLIQGDSFYKPDEEKLVAHLKNGGRLRYMIGNICLKTLNAVPVEVGVGMITGTKEYCEIPVKMVYVEKDDVS